MVLTTSILRKPRSNKIYTHEEYLRFEEKAQHKNEFYKGLINPIAGAKATHNEISANVVSTLKNGVRPLKTIYRVYTSDQKIRIETEDTTVYPDALVICEKPEFWNGREDVIVNPFVIVEVLSKSTQNYDRGEKFMLYQRLPSLKEYVVVEQHTALVESWYQIEENTWQKTAAHGVESNLSLRSLGITLRLEDVYEHITF
ncbi:Uma2 family endonuclease [Runella rosea]|uniref:Uma2 family endonuclease n=1 Tax=Runella rosea TaxID=2259595 RepID=A0A344TQE3_9BACT|nr:Uma2 family endonuclease [Runella rosea]AXE20864.1 Uma2 family endonuclease [Runella rosea]